MYTILKPLAHISHPAAMPVAIKTHRETLDAIYVPGCIAFSNERIFYTQITIKDSTSFHQRSFTTKFYCHCATAIQNEAINFHMFYLLQAAKPIAPLALPTNNPFAILYFFVGSNGFVRCLLSVYTLTHRDTNYVCKFISVIME